MPAHTPLSPSPGSSGIAPPSGPGVHGRLPWWALALPVLGFAALLVMIADPAQADSGGEWALARMAEYLWRLFIL
jgi:hypothetical protein